MTLFYVERQTLTIHQPLSLSLSLSLVKREIHLVLLQTSFRSTSFQSVWLFLEFTRISELSWRSFSSTSCSSVVLLVFTGRASSLLKRKTVDIHWSNGKWAFHNTETTIVQTRIVPHQLRWGKILMRGNCCDEEDRTIVVDHHWLFKRGSISREDRRIVSLEEMTVSGSRGSLTSEKSLRGKIEGSNMSEAMKMGACPEHSSKGISVHHCKSPICECRSRD